MVIFGIKECEAMSGKERQEIDLKEVQNILKDCCEVELKQDNVAKVIRMGKYTRKEKTNYNNDWNRRKEERNI